MDCTECTRSLDRGHISDVCDSPAVCGTVFVCGSAAVCVIDSCVLVLSVRHDSRGIKHGVVGELKNPIDMILKKLPADRG